MDIEESNRQASAKAWRRLALFVAAYAAAWLLLSHSIAHPVATECRVVRLDQHDCAFEHQIGGNAYRGARQSCDSAFWARRALGTPPDARSPEGWRSPCYYLAGRPRDLFLEPRVSGWSRPLSYALLAAGLIGAAFANARSRPRRRPEAPAAPPDEGPYRRPPEAEAPGGPPKPAPLSLDFVSFGWFMRLLFGVAPLVWGAIAIRAACSALLDPADHHITGRFDVDVALGHFLFLFGAFIGFHHERVELLPDEGALVSSWRLGPFSGRTAYDLRELGEASAGSNDRVKVRRHDDLFGLSWFARDREQSKRYAASINEFLDAWRRWRAPSSP
jgi:hypothetical protein